MWLVGSTYIPVENLKTLSLSPDHFPAKRYDKGSGKRDLHDDTTYIRPRPFVVSLWFILPSLYFLLQRAHSL